MSLEPALLFFNTFFALRVPGTNIKADVPDGIEQGNMRKMKKALLLIFTMVLASAAFAQQQFAVLNHNDTISAFYGINALSQAHSAAVGGDIITLSSGVFNGIGITKPVTIRGAGMWSIDSLQIQNTVILTDITLNIPFDSTYSLEMEGLFIKYIIYAQAYNPVFKKCRFVHEFSRNSNGTMANAQFINCVLYKYGGAGLTGTQFINSVIFDGLSAPSQLDHCVARIYNDLNALTSMVVYNSVVYDNTYEHPDFNSSSSYYSIGINTWINGSYYYRYFDITNVTGHYLWNKRAYNQVFKYWNGTYSEGLSFELLDDVAASYIGDDSTQVGIYGGLYPFDPVVRPVIGTVNAARRTNADMKLEVEINLINE